MRSGFHKLLSSLFLVWTHFPFSSAYDAEYQRLFVSDSENSRVLVFELPPDVKR